MIAISKLAASVKPSATLAAGAKAKALADAGIRVFDFSLGEPDFPTPAHICDAAERAAREGHTHYTPSPGIMPLRKAVCDWYLRKYGLKVEPAEVLISAGAKHSIHNALAAVLDPGDEVVIPTPYWVSYGDLVSMTGAVPVLVKTTPESKFKMTPDQFRAALSPRSKLVMLNSPCNPSGTVYTRSELAALVDVAAAANLIILSDEIYEQLTYGAAEPTCVATLRPDLEDRMITISGASKSYAMTGWRMGWTIAPPAVIAAMNTIQSQETGCTNSVSQYALLAALTGPQECVAEMRDHFARRRDLTVGLLRALPGITFPEPEGAFYVFFDVSQYFGKVFGNIAVKDSVGFCTAALEQAKVNFVPGAAFGQEGFARISFACGDAAIVEGLKAFAAWLPTGRTM